jgi:hypothetical protein
MTMLNNQWTHGKTHFVLPPLPPEFRAAEGIIPWRLALDPNVGSEIVLLLLDRTPFVEDLAKIRPFDLRLKTGAGSNVPRSFVLSAILRSKSDAARCRAFFSRCALESV